MAHQLGLRRKIDAEVIARPRQHGQRQRKAQGLDQRRNGAGLQGVFGQQPGQCRRQQQRAEPIALVAVEHPGHLAVHDGQRHGANQCEPHGSAQVAASVQTAAGQRQRGQPPQQRQAGERAAVVQLCDGQAHVVRLHFGGRDIGEHGLHAGDARQEGHDRRGDAPHRKAAAGHIIAGQVVVGTKVKGRAEPCGVVPHKAHGHQHDRQQECSALPRPGAAAQPLLGDIARPENRQGQHGKKHHLRAAAGHQRHAQAAEGQVEQDGLALCFGRVGGAKPLPQCQQNKRSTA